MQTNRRPLTKGIDGALDFSRKRFLVIDDFSDMRSMLRSMLEAYGARHIDQAANGRDAIELMSRHPYDVVLCDYNLGDGQDGQQVLEEARFRGLVKFSTVFVMVTAENTVRMVMGAVEYQPDGYLSKPFNKFQLRSRLERIIARKGDFAAIERAIEKRQYARAIELCDERLAEQPGNAAEILRLKAGLLMDRASYEEAEALFRQVLAERDAPWARIGLGKARFLSGDYPAARDIFQAIIDDNQHNMEAHDWLSKTLVKLGEIDRAKEVLVAAVELSPKAIQRQMALGDLALKTKDHELAARAFRKAVTLGKNSVYRTPANYIKQAKALSHGSGKEALRVLRNLNKEFRGDKEAQLQAAATATVVYKGMGLEEDAQTAFRETERLYEETRDRLSPEAALEVARSFFAQGDRERAVTLMEQVIANHHDNDGLLEEVQEVFSEAGLEDEGGRIITQTREGVVQLNNRGVQLAEAGQLEEAIGLFEQALQDLPANKTVNMNTAKVLLLYMKRHGRNDRYLHQVREYLERLRRMDPDSSTLRRLFEMYEAVRSGEGRSRAGA